MKIKILYLGLLLSILIIGSIVNISHIILATLILVISIPFVIGTYRGNKKFDKERKYTDRNFGSKIFSGRSSGRSSSQKSTKSYGRPYNPATQSQKDYLRDLGYHGPEPSSSSEADDIIKRRR